MAIRCEWPSCGKLHTRNSRFCSTACSNRGAPRHVPRKCADGVGICADPTCSCKQRGPYIPPRLELKKCAAPNCMYQTTNKMYCSRSCAIRVANTSQPKRKKLPLRTCELEGCTVVSTRKYCTNEHRWTQHRNEKLRAWRADELDGAKIWHIVRNFMIKEAGGECSWCGWAKPNPITKRVSFVLDHIDGDWINCRYENLQLLCGACNTLTTTFGNLNSRAQRRKRGLPDIAMTRVESGKRR